MLNIFQKKYKTGVALSGGGARGFAHFGALQALSEKGITPDFYSGVSAGALVGTLVASGKTPREAFEIMRHHKLIDFTAIRFPRRGLFAMDHIRKTLKKEVKSRRIEDLDLPLVVGISNMLKGHIEYRSEGLIEEVVIASCSIPVLFAPVRIGNQLYADGGVFDNLPVRALKDCRRKIGINVTPITEVKEINSIVDMAVRMFQLSVNANLLEKGKKCDLFINPHKLDAFELMDTKKAEQIYNIGYYEVLGMKNKMLN